MKEKIAKITEIKDSIEPQDDLDKANALIDQLMTRNYDLEEELENEGEKLAHLQEKYDELKDTMASNKKL